MVVDNGGVMVYDNVVVVGRDVVEVDGVVIIDDGEGGMYGGCRRGKTSDARNACAGYEAKKCVTDCSLLWVQGRREEEEKRDV